MEFRVLGLLEVIGDDGARVELGPGNESVLLALLLLDANRPVSVDRLIEGLWGERAPPSAPRSIQAYVSRLRRRLPHEQLETTAGGYQLRVEPDMLDAERFERLAREGKELQETGDAAGAATVLSEALALWRGPALADFENESFAQEEIRRLEELRAAATADHVDARLAAGSAGDLVGELQELVAAHPLWERARAQLMLALYRAGRQAEALDAYQAARDLLVQELGIEPAKPLRDLHQAILRQAPSLDLAQVAPAPAGGPGRFVGRRRELATLQAALDAMRAGTGRLLLLVGEPGIGKSRLAEEFAARCARSGTEVLVGRSWEAGGAPMFWPWVQALRPYVRNADETSLRSQLGNSAAVVAQLLPDVRERLPDLSEPPSLEPEAARFRLFDATAEFLRRASAETPIVVVIDDLHAADATSMLLLQYVARVLSSMQLIIVATVRDVDPTPGAELASLLADLAREPVTQRLSLERLSADDVAEYVDDSAAEIATPALANALFAETEGNPLFLVEAVRLLTAPQTESTRPAVPETVREVLTRRIAQLAPDCLEVLELGSVLGREFRSAALAELASLPEDVLLEKLEGAFAGRVVSEIPGAPGRLRFTHVLIRDLFYERLGPARRVRAHRRALTALETIYGLDRTPHLDELAHHAIAGLDPNETLTYAQQAADRALELLAHEEAARLYAVALEALPRVDGANSSRRCELLLSLGEAELLAGRSTAAKTVFAEAAAIARQTGSVRELARAAVGYGGRSMYSRAGRDKQLVALLEEALAALDGHEDVELRVKLLARLAGALRDERVRDRRDGLTREALALARQTENPIALASALDGRLAAMIAPDTVEECLEIAGELIAVAEAGGAKEHVFYGRLGRYTAQVVAGALGPAEADLATVNRLASELRQPQQLFQACAAEAMFALGQGRLSHAEASIDRARGHGERAQPEMAIPIYVLQRYALRELRGDSTDVSPEIVALIADYPARPVFRCLLAHLDARLGRRAEAAEALAELTADSASALPFDQEWLLATSLLAEAAVATGERGPAAVLYDLLVPWADLNVADYPEAIRGSVARYLGLLATQLELFDEAESQFRHALEANERMRLHPWLAFTEADYGRMLLARGRTGDGARGRGLLDGSRARLRGLGIPAV
ncbi:MAG: ATP-binding protein [Gaiellaceae bacterium]